MMKWTALLLLFAIGIVWVIPFDIPTDAMFWANYLEYLGKAEVPSLFSDFEPGSEFLETLTKTADIAFLPIRWVVFIGYQIYRTINYFRGYIT